ncbi:MAG: PilZ domain-containing protein [Pyrinomonadaceae bacterium]
MLLDLYAPAADAGTGDDCVTAERRAHPRVAAPVLALVRMRAVTCGRVEEAAALDDVGRGGFRVRLCLRPEPGARVFALLRLTAAPGIEGGGPLVAVRGRVLRVEPEPGGGYSVAVAITRYRFFELRFLTSACGRTSA